MFSCTQEHLAQCPFQEMLDYFPGGGVSLYVPTLLTYQVGLQCTYCVRQSFKVNPEFVQRQHQASKRWIHITTYSSSSFTHCSVGHT